MFFRVHQISQVASFPQKGEPDCKECFRIIMECVVHSFQGHSLAHSSSHFPTLFFPPNTTCAVSRHPRPWPRPKVLRNSCKIELLPSYALKSRHNCCPPPEDVMLASCKTYSRLRGVASSIATCQSAQSGSAVRHPYPEANRPRQYQKNTN